MERSWWIMRGVFVVVVALLAGCGAAARFAVKKPVSDQCASQGLQRCEELTDGVLAYVEGDKTEAETKLRAAAAGNSPEQMKQFANALRPVADNLGGDTGESLRGVIALLTSEAPPATSSSAVAKAAAAKPGSSSSRAPHDGPALAVVSDDHDQMRTFTVPGGLDERALECMPSSVMSGAGLCKQTRVAVGPMVLTNLYASGGCPDELFIIAGRTDRPQWFVLVPANAPLNVTGKLSVDDGVELAIGLRTAATSPSKDVRCALTWSGYRRSTM